METPKSVTLRFEIMSFCKVITLIQISDRWLRIGFLIWSQDVRDRIRDRSSLEYCILLLVSNEDNQGYSRIDQKWNCWNRRIPLILYFSRVGSLMQEFSSVVETHSSLLSTQLQCIVLRGAFPPPVAKRNSVQFHTQAHCVPAPSPRTVVSFGMFSPSPRSQLLCLQGLAPPIGLLWLTSQKQSFTLWIDQPDATRLLEFLWRMGNIFKSHSLSHGWLELAADWELGWCRQPGNRQVDHSFKYTCCPPLLKTSMGWWHAELPLRYTIFNF